MYKTPQAYCTLDRRLEYLAEGEFCNDRTRSLGKQRGPPLDLPGSYKEDALMSRTPGDIFPSHSPFIMRTGASRTTDANESNKVEYTALNKLSW